MTAYSDFLASDAIAIFVFHGVIPEHRNEVRNYTRKHIDTMAFSAVLDDLCEHGVPLSTDDVIAMTLAGSPFPSGGFSVTFDDGFLNNLEVAAPILKSKGVPATFYVTSSWVDENAIGWIDQIEQVFERQGTVRLDCAFPALNRTARTTDEKRQLLTDIRNTLKFQSDVDPLEFSRRVVETSGIHLAVDSLLDAKLSWSDVKTLDADSLFTIGGHGHTHRVLSRLSRVDLEYEVDTSLRLISRATNRSVRHYSYPDGFSGCYSEEVIQLLKDRGIKSAPTAEPGVNRPGADLYRLKRIFVT